MKSKSLFANYFLDSDHQCNPEVNFVILHVKEKSYKLNRQEIFEINKAIKLNKSLLNSQVHFNSYPLPPGVQVFHAVYTLLVESLFLFLLIPSLI